MLVQDIEPQLVRPPVAVRPSDACDVFGSLARYQVLAVFVHYIFPPFIELIVELNFV
jgi:hypothetical protein